MFTADWINIILALIGVWIGATLAVKPIDEIAKKFNTSSFIISFFVLGLFTSLTEISVAFNSYMGDTLDISIGNLLGGSIVLLLFVIPLLGILSNGIKLNHSLGVGYTFLAIIYLLIPHFLLIDKVLSFNESIFLFCSYLFLALLLYFKDIKALPVKKKVTKEIHKSKIIFAFLFVALGSGILIISSNILVESIDQIGASINLSPFILALIGLSIGTNLPEISLAIVAAIRGRADIGFGNYLGSAMFNPLIMSFLGMATGGLRINENFVSPLIFSFVGFLLFFFFMKSNNFLSRKESFILFSVYLLFVIVELVSF